MDQNQNVDNDLQQAIDNINNDANSANNTVDASANQVFSEPVAAPSSIPEGDSGILDEPVGPFPTAAPEPKVGIVTPGPEPIAPFDPISIPDLGTKGEATVTPAPDFGHPEPIIPGAPMPGSLSPTDSNASNSPAMTGPNPSSDSHSPDSDSKPNFSASSNPSHENLDTHKIKEAALRDLVPLLSHVKAEPKQKFELCRDIIENLHDSSAFGPAYDAASAITNEDERAEALLYLVESIDDQK